MIILGLTGSIGMGKSTTSNMFRELDIKVYDADETVHALYRGNAAVLIEQAFPGTTVAGVVDRAKLSKFVVGKPEAMKKLENIIHPLVHQKQTEFMKNAEIADEKIVVLDIPLLFEGGRENSVDAVIVVTCQPEEQRRRVLARPGMTVEKFEAILARQVPDSTKRAKADFIINTDKGMDSARQQVLDVINTVSAPDYKR